MLLLQQIREAYKQKSIPLFEILARTLKFKSFDCRDRIFAVIGMSDERNNINLRPDYLRTTEEVFKSLTISVLNKGFPPLILASATPLTELEKLPSWVADWGRDDRDVYTLANQSFTAGGFAPISAQLSLDYLELRVLGTTISKVKEVVETPDLNHAKVEDWLSPPILGNIADLLREPSGQHHAWIEKFVHLASSTLDRRTTSSGLSVDEVITADPFWRILTCNRDLEANEPTPEFCPILRKLPKRSQRGRGQH